MFNEIAQNIVSMLKDATKGNVTIQNITELDDVLNMPLPSVLLEWTGYSVAQEECNGKLTRANINFTMHVSSKSAVGNGKNDDAMQNCLDLLYLAISSVVGQDAKKGNYVHLADCSKSMLEGNGFYTVQANIFINTSVSSNKDKATWKNMRT